MRRIVTLFLVFVIGCSSPPSFGAQHEELRVCADGPTVDGIDVSHWQGTIDWDRVAADGVRFAFIRVSHGLGTYDDQYDRNWPEARRVGILRGTYQYFQPDQDPIAQADLLLEHMGALQPDDLPPVIDVEATGGMTGPQIAAAVKLWLDHVEAAIGRKPIIYSGYYFWRDNVGDPPGFSDYPLWIPQYGPTCPLIPDSWARWAFFQTSSTGSIDGISGNVDTDLWNGTEDDLLAFANPVPVCGDGRCSGGEDHASCASDCPICEPIPPEGRVVEETEICFLEGGPASSWRHVDGEGSDGHVTWTYATANPTENFGTWILDVAEAGLYRIEAHTPAPYGASTMAPYTVLHGGTADLVRIDQSAVDGWQLLGDFQLAAGGDQHVKLEDSTGEPYADRVMIAFDAIRLTRLDLPADAGTDVDAGVTMPGSDASVEGDAGMPPITMLDGGCGCRVVPRSTPTLPLVVSMAALALVLARRRRV